MKKRWLLPLLGCAGIMLPICGEDWPQWRGINRDGKASFSAPGNWPKELKKGWSVTVGDGVASPVMVGERVFVYARQGGDEVIRCLNARDGKEVWTDKHAARGADGPAAGFAGPRCTPTIVNGKVVTLGVRGTLTCYDASTGNVAWRIQDPTGKLPRFCTSSSPLIADGKCVVQCGGEDGGGIFAFDMQDGKELWKWVGDGTAYASPDLQTVGGTKIVVAETAKNIVGLDLTSGKQLFLAPFSPEAGRGRGYNSSSPVVKDDLLIISGSGRGSKIFKVVKVGEQFELKELWSNKDNSVIYNTPVLNGEWLFCMSQSDLIFCINSKDGKTAWTAQMPGTSAPAPAGEAKTDSKAGDSKGFPPGKAGGMRGGGMRGTSGYGTLVDAGSVIFAMTPKGKLVAFAPSGSEFKTVASYDVAKEGTYAYPLITDKRIFIKDKDSLTLWTLD